MPTSRNFAIVLSLCQLQHEKNSAVRDEDYDEAKRLKVISTWSNFDKENYYNWL